MPFFSSSGRLRRKYIDQKSSTYLEEIGMKKEYKKNNITVEKVAIGLSRLS